MKRVKESVERLNGDENKRNGIEWKLGRRIKYIIFINKQS